MWRLGCLYQILPPGPKRWTLLPCLDLSQDTRSVRLGGRPRDVCLWWSGLVEESGGLQWEGSLAYWWVWGSLCLSHTWEAGPFPCVMDSEPAAFSPVETTPEGARLERPASSSAGSHPLISSHQTLAVFSVLVLPCTHTAHTHPRRLHSDTDKHSRFDFLSRFSLLHVVI